MQHSKSEGEREGRDATDLADAKKTVPCYRTASVPYGVGKSNGNGGTTITATTATTTTTSPTTTTRNYYDHYCYDDDDLRLLPLRCGGGPSRTPPNSYHYHWHYNYDYHYNDDYHYYYHYYHYHYCANGRWVMCGEEGGRKPREKPRKVGLEAMLVRRAPTWNRTTEHRGMWHGQKLGDFEQHGRV